MTGFFLTGFVFFFVLAVLVPLVVGSFVEKFGDWRDEP